MGEEDEEEEEQEEEEDEALLNPLTPHAAGMGALALPVQDGAQSVSEPVGPALAQSSGAVGSYVACTARPNRRPRKRNS